MAASPSPSPETDISIGTVLDGRYRIDALLGTGGMGRVYRGEHTGIGRPVAIKVLHADLSRNREAAQRFQREAIASGRLDHQNIVGVSDFGIVDDGPCYLVMEVLEGEGLGARLEREKKLPWRDALRIMRGVLHGLQHAHDRGVVHRDIKPDNVFLAKKDHETIVKILDFGIAKLYAGSPDDPASTRAGLTVGTPAYLSPEQAVGGEIKPQSDLYSATILLFEMITGRAPFEDKDPLAMLGAHVSREPPTMAEVAPGIEVPPGLEDVIEKGLIKTSGDRIGSAQEYLALLERVVRDSSPAIPIPPDPLGHASTDTLPATVTPPAGTLAPTGPSTPSPDAIAVGAAPTAAALPNVTRAISLADSPPIPRNWIKLGAIVVGVLILGAILLAIAGGSSKAKSPKQPTPRASTPPAPEPVGEAKPVARVERNPVEEARPPEPPLPIVLPSLTDTRETKLKALLHDLENGKTCPDRKAPIQDLVELGDKNAVPALRKARFRMRGGVLGIGASNSNNCLRAAAEAAIKSLGGKLK